jgi:soluble lytic murein transglycosylase-like protein
VDGEIPTLAGVAARTFDAGVRRWEKLACAAAHEFGVPVHWILGMIFSESGGIPSARSPVGAIGLMQLHSAAAKGGLSDEQILDPETNIRLGARLISRIYFDGDQLPEVASKYNAGGTPNGQPHESSSSPWRMREDPGHIDRTVAAANYAAETLTVCKTQALPERQLEPRPPVVPRTPAPCSPGSSSSSARRGSGLGVPIGLGLIAFGLYKFGGRRRARAR